MNRTQVDSLYVSRSTGDRVCIRTYLEQRGDSYVITANGRRLLNTRSTETVRMFIMRNDCRPVESFEE